MSDRFSYRKRSRSKFTSLPVELWSQIVSDLDPHAICSLARTSKVLSTYVRTHGWQAYISRNYPGYDGRPLWQNAAHSLTRLSRAWESKALNARVILPESRIKLQSIDQTERGNAAATNANPRASSNNLPSRSTNALALRPRQRRHGQTMGYQPALDVMERWTGGEWTDKTEILTVGAGAEVLVRSRSTSRQVDLEELSLKESDQKHCFRDDNEHRLSWQSFKGSHHRDGLDDITALKLLSRNPHSDLDEKLELLVGRASGHLDRITISLDAPAHSEDVAGTSVATTSQTYNTSSLPVRFMELMPQSDVLSSNKHFVAGLGSREVAFYSSTSTDPLCQIPISCGTGSTSRTWSSSFLSRTSLAVGHGISKTPLDLYAVRPEEGLSETPIRRFNLTKPNAVYALAPLVSKPSLMASSGPGNLLAAGMYDGTLLIHDMRDKRDVVARFFDPVEAGTAIYSVLPIQSNIILAGTAMHGKVCIFDIRAGGMLSSINATSSGRGSSLSVEDNQSNSFTQSSSSSSGGSSLYLARHALTDRGNSSSVYSLASCGGPTFYAGLEDTVMQIDAWRSSDSHPDSVFKPVQLRYKGATEARGRKYVSLSMMTHTPAGDGASDGAGDGAGTGTAPEAPEARSDRYALFYQAPFGSYFSRGVESRGSRDGRGRRLDYRWRLT